MGLKLNHIVDFSHLHKYDLDEIGKKAYQLDEFVSLKIPIPDGFVIMPSFFESFLKTTGIGEDIRKIQAISHPAIKESMHKLFQPISKKIIHTHIPQELASELHDAYRKLSGLFKEPLLNIYTSPLKGKKINYLNVEGDANFFLTIKKIWSTQIENTPPIIVQKKIKSNIHGKITTDNPSVYEKDKVMVNLVNKIKKYFYFPQEIEYAVFKGKTYITGMEPLTKIPEVKRILPIIKQRKILAKGIPLPFSSGIITGTVRLLRNQDYYQVKTHEIAVIPELNKLLYSKISKAKAIIADAEFKNSYDKAVYRKNVKIPTIMGTKNAINILRNGNIITVNGTSGEIYSGGLIY